MKSNAKKNSPEDFDFIVTTGDMMRSIEKGGVRNLKETRKMLNYFRDSDSLSKVPIYPVRGNYGTTSHSPREWVDLRLRYKNFRAINRYYTTEFTISPPPFNEKMSLIHLDSNLMLCHLMKKGWPKDYVKLLDHRTAKIFNDHCVRNFTRDDRVKDYKYRGKQ